MQETFVLYDCTKYDLATSDSHNDIWTLGNNGSPKLERKTDYSTLSELISGTDAWITTQISHSCAIEFDVQLITTNYDAEFCQFGQSVNAMTRRAIPLLIKDGNWHNIKLSLDNGTVVVSSKETSNTQTYNLNNYDSTGQMYFRFRTALDITEINFKNMKIYPI